MAYELKLAWRYFRSGRRRLTRFTSVVAIAGIAAGLAAFIVAQGLSNGFAEEVGRRILAHSGHIVVTGPEGSGANWQVVRSKILAVPDVASVEATTMEPSAIVADGLAAYAVLMAVEDADPAESGTSSVSEPRVILGDDLAERIGAEKGSAAQLIVPGKAGNAEPVNVIVEGTFDTGLYEYDSVRVAASRSDIARILGTERFEAGTYLVKVDDVFRTEAATTAVREALGSDFAVTDWRETNRPLFEALSLERLFALIIIFLIVLVAAMNITTTLALLVRERLVDIAVLRTCGARSRAIGAVFLLEGSVLGLIGIAGGLAIGLGSCYLLNALELIRLPPEVYSVSRFGCSVSFYDTALAAAGVFGVCLAAMAVPVLRAVRTKPAEVLRTR